MPGDEPRVIATFGSYAEMLEAIRARVDELQIHGERFDNFAGLPDGYFAKLVGARPIRRLGMVSFAPVLAGLGLKCQFVEDQAATARLKNHVAPRNGSYVRADATHVVLTFRFMQKIGRLGAQARIDNSTKQQRSNGRARRRSHGGGKIHEAPLVLSACHQAPLRRRAPRPGALVNFSVSARPMRAPPKNQCSFGTCGKLGQFGTSRDFLLFRHILGIGRWCIVRVLKPAECV